MGATWNESLVLVGAEDSVKGQDSGSHWQINKLIDQGLVFLAHSVRTRREARGPWQIAPPAPSLSLDNTEVLLLLLLSNCNFILLLPIGIIPCTYFFQLLLFLVANVFHFIPKVLGNTISVPPVLSLV